MTDVDALFAVQKAASLAGFAHIFPPEQFSFPDEAVRRELAAQIAAPAARVLTEEIEGCVVGFALLENESMHRLFVLPEFWGKGVAARLHDEALDVWRNLGVVEARLWVLEENERARRFYERHGWSDDGMREPTQFPPYPVRLRYRLDVAHT